MYRAQVVTGETDLSSLSYFLYQQGVPHKITEESGELVLWTANEEQGQLVQQVYRDWQSGLLQLQPAPARRGVELGNAFRAIPWRSFPVTMVFLVACLVVAVLTQLGKNMDMVSHFTFVTIKISGQYAYFASLAQTLDAGEYWRLLSPIFLHFGIIHLAFNMLWLFDLGRRIEHRQGGVHLIGIVLVTGLLSNVAQYWFGGDTSIFGGFSGVIYGFLGYCLAREKLDPNTRFGCAARYLSVYAGLAGDWLHWDSGCDRLWKHGEFSAFWRPAGRTADWFTGWTAAESTDSRFG